MTAIPSHQALLPGESRPLPQITGTAAGQEIPGEQILDWRRRMLALGGAAGELDWLLDLVGGLPWSQLQMLRCRPGLRLRLRRNLGDLERLWRRHLDEDTPLQYLAGICAWRNHRLRVTPSVLIPRPETELLVELALERSRAASLPSPLLWADLGTGSGCLALALAHAFPDSQGMASDRSEAALRVAAFNLRKGGEQRRVELRQGDWWDAVRSHRGRISLAVANPPYIPSAGVACLDPVVRCHEPWQALDGGEDGLREIRRVVAGAPGSLAPGGLLLLEHHHDQSAAVLHLLHCAGLEEIQAHRDLEGVMRFASGRRPPTEAVS